MDFVKSENIKVEIADFEDDDMDTVQDLTNQINEAKYSVVKALETAQQLLSASSDTSNEYFEMISTPLISAVDALTLSLTAVQSLPVLTLGSTLIDEEEAIEEVEVKRRRKPMKRKATSPPHGESSSKQLITEQKQCAKQNNAPPTEVKTEQLEYKDGEQDLHKLGDDLDKLFDKTEQTDLRPRNNDVLAPTIKKELNEADTKVDKNDVCERETSDYNDSDYDNDNHDDNFIADHLKDESGEGEEEKIYKCSRCPYTTNRKYYFDDHILGTLKYRKCPWCEKHLSNTGFKALQKHFKLKHGQVQGKYSKCLKCDKTFNRMRDLELHVNREHPDVSTMYHCSQCNYNSIMYDMTRHKEVHSSVSFPCNLCNHKAKSAIRLRTHMNELHKTVKCTICHEEFRGSYALRMHKRSQHGDGKKRELYCDECGQKYTNTGSLSLHKQAKHSDKTYQCDKCEFTATNKNSLGKHMKTHNLSCDLCSAQFSSRNDFNVHMKGVHGGHKYRCDQCEFSSAWRETLKNHISSKHSREGLYKCDICNAGFPRRNTLATHMQIHDDREKQRQYECSYVGCQSTFTAPSQLKKHVAKVHEGVRWPCDRCDFIGSYKDDLKLHIKAVHEGFKLKCDQCDFTTIKNTKLKVHILKVHEGVTWPCDKCDYVGDIKDKLNMHIRAVHKGLMKKCDICSYTSITNSNVKRHMRRIHKVQI